MMRGGTRSTAARVASAVQPSSLPASNLPARQTKRGSSLFSRVPSCCVSSSPSPRSLSSRLFSSSSFAAAPLAAASSCSLSRGSDARVCGSLPALGAVSLRTDGPVSCLSGASWALWGATEQRRGVARLKSHRYGGVVALKTRAPKSPWYIEAEKEFLNERAQVPDAYIERWHGEDLAKLSPSLRRCLHLRCASSSQLHQWRKLQLCRLLQRRPFDTGSPAVQLACLTEKILNVRAHLLKFFRDQQKKKVLSIWISRRHRLMKYLYRVDYDLYKHVCQQLRIKCVRFAIPDSRDRQRAISPIAVDGDRCKFLIRQKLWKARFRPRQLKQADGKVVRYTRHPMEQPSSGWNLPKEHRPALSRAWPYGVREERLTGEYVIHNPTAAGLGHCPAPLFF
ncbi:putative 30S ribosomal protein S15 [Besnoitia besnoiti]|uniref:Putative 30S ribosomal protein S15 n=1 Tax=Besnoitia besnoiti TaxID=94643 RepID=A0A2A9M8V6_BESBE|nr:putative 30S ribosomal protein S15 [Besnoitia besnoiti]PFH34918.1 putative 30S ribosomal protein S15 [Besnoitia besnoiti]